MNNLEMIYKLVNTICADEMSELKDYISEKSAFEIKATNTFVKTVIRVFPIRQNRSFNPRRKIIKYGIVSLKK